MHCVLPCTSVIISYVGKPKCDYICMLQRLKLLVS